MDPQEQKRKEEYFEEQQQNEKKLLTKSLVFREYPSIEISTRTKTINSIRQLGFDKQNILWVASEKIHGSNFSIHCSGEKVRYGRRTDFLTDDIEIKCQDSGTKLKQSFYDARKLVPTLHPQLQNVYKTIKEAYPDMLKFAIYGQYFGGLFPNQDNGFKHVQKGVYYTPNHQFMAFDIRIQTDKTSFWVDVEDIPKLLKDNIKSVPIYARGTFDQMLNINSKIDSTIPELLGFHKVENNMIEGFVIRPNHNLKSKQNDRIMLKKKNAEFVEATSAPKQGKQKKQVVVDPAVQPYLQFLQKYLNFNRIQSATSKFPDLKDRNKLKNQIIADIMKDALKDQYKEPELVQLRKKVGEQLSKRTMKLLNEYYTQN